MEIVVASLAFLVAALCAATMGFAIQRGATCAVAAVEEVVRAGSCRRLAALFEAALWVAGGLLVAQAAHWLPTMPPGYALGAWTIVGGVLLGLGAFVNGACVFGAIARFGSGEWAYLLTPLGFYLGCVSVPVVFAPPAAQKLSHGSPVLGAPAWLRPGGHLLVECAEHQAGVAREALGAAGFDAVVHHDEDRDATVIAGVLVDAP